MVEAWVVVLLAFGLGVGLIAAAKFYVDRRMSGRDVEAAREREAAARQEADRLRRDRDEAARAAATPEPAAEAAPEPAAAEPSAEDLLGAAAELGVDGEGVAVDLTTLTTAAVHELEREAGTLAVAEPNPFALRRTVAEILAWDNRVQEEWQVLERAARAAKALDTILRRGLRGEDRNREAQEQLATRTGDLNRLIEMRGTGEVPPEAAPAIETGPADDAAELRARMDEAREMLGGAA